MGCGPWGREESDTTERLHFHFSLSCIGEGNGNPLQYSCLENPRDGGAWWAAVYGVAQSRIRLKRLSGSSISSPIAGLGRGLRFQVPWRRKWQPTPVFLRMKSHRHRSLVGYSPQGHKTFGCDSATKHQQQQRVQCTDHMDEKLEGLC